MKYTASAGVIALSLGAFPAFAGGVVETQPAPVAVPPVVPAAVGTDWTGPYVGAQLEYGDVTVDDDSGEIGSGDGALYGIFGGYRYDFGNFVLGGEIDLMAADIDLGDTVDGSLDAVYRVGVEAGFDAGRALFYGTAGYAYAEVSGDGGDLDGDGYFYGIGMDYLVTDNITVGGEILQHEFEDFDDFDGLDVDATTVGVNVAFQF